MSSYYGGGFAEWIDDSFNTTPDKLLAIRAIMWPHRESIDAKLEDFSDAEHSWRQFRNDLWYGYDAEDQQIQAVLRGDLTLDVVLARTVLLRIPLDPMHIDISIDPQRSLVREFFTGHYNEMNASLRSAFDETCSRCHEARTLHITAVIYGDGHVTFEVA